MCHIQLKQLRMTVRNPDPLSSPDWNEKVNGNDHAAIRIDWERIIGCARAEFPDEWAEFDRRKAANEAEAAHVEQFVPDEFDQADADRLVRKVRSDADARRDGGAPEQYDMATDVASSWVDAAAESPVHPSAKRKVDEEVPRPPKSPKQQDESADPK